MKNVKINDDGTITILIGTDQSDVLELGDWLLYSPELNKGMKVPYDEFNRRFTAKTFYI